MTTSGNASGTSVTAIKPGDTMTIDGGKNIVLTQNGAKVSIATTDTPTFSSVGIDGGGPVLSASGLNMAGQKITNVAPGDVSATSTDAVNVSHLHALQSNVDSLSGSAVQYDRNPDGSIDYTHVTMNPGGASTTITNVARGNLFVTSTDAVNGAQLSMRQIRMRRTRPACREHRGRLRYQVLQCQRRRCRRRVGFASAWREQYRDGIAGDSERRGQRGSGLERERLEPGRDRQRCKRDARRRCHPGRGAVADCSGRHYIGKYSGAQSDTAGSVSVGSPDAERTVSHVVDGRNATDTVNLRQLDGAVKTANDYTDQRITDVSGAITEIGATTKQFGDQVTNVQGQAVDLASGKPSPSASDDNSLAACAGAAASGSGSAALGNDSDASGNNAVALGNGSQTSHDQFCIGRRAQRRAPDRQRRAWRRRYSSQLRAVERGMNGRVAGIQRDIQHMDDRLSAGVATTMAMATLPQAYLPGKSMGAFGDGDQFVARRSGRVGRDGLSVVTHHAVYRKGKRHLRIQASRSVRWLSALVAAWLATYGNVSQSGTTDKPVFPDVTAATIMDYTWPDPQAVRAGMTKDQLYALLDRPHFNEGLWGVREWDDVFHASTTDSDRLCQYKILFAADMRARSFLWKPDVCANAFNSPTRS